MAEMSLWIGKPYDEGSTEWCSLTLPDRKAALRACLRPKVYMLSLQLGHVLDLLEGQEDAWVCVTLPTDDSAELFLRRLDAPTPPPKDRNGHGGPPGLRLVRDEN